MELARGSGVLSGTLRAPAHGPGAPSAPFQGPGTPSAPVQEQGKLWAPVRLANRVSAASGHGALGVAVRMGSMAVAAVLAALVHHFHDPGTLCPIRALTGVPCPMCGGTTVFMDLGAGHPVQAAAANPFALAGAIGLATAPLGTGRLWWAISPRSRAWFLGVVIALSWLWQLARFGLLPW